MLASDEKQHIDAEASANSGEPAARIAHCPAGGGWVRVRAVIQASIPSVAWLALDRGGGFEPRGRLELGAVEGMTRLDRLIHLPAGVRRVRLEPLSHPGQAVVESFSLAPRAAVAVHAGALVANLRRALGGGGAGHRPSVWLGIKLLLCGQWTRFRRQMVANAQATAATAAYDAWRRRRALTDADRERMRAVQSAWPDPPLISVLLPVYNVAEPYLRAAVESVRGQIYPHWELCIADDASPSPHVRRVLEEFAAAERRIKLLFRTANGNISAASNSALELASGPYVALLDHDDVLAEHALHAMAAAIVEDPTIDLLYSDEDKISADGSAHFEPFFKPDWSPEYLLSCMYPCHLSVIRTELVRRLGGFRSAFDSAQDYDLALRLLGANARVRHVPDVLYHWRTIASSAASGAGAKPAAHARAAAALADHLQRVGRPGKVEPGPGEGYHRIRYQRASTPRVSVIIPTRSLATGQRRSFGRQRTWEALRCVQGLRFPRLQIVVVFQVPVDAGLMRAHKVHVVSPPPQGLSRSAAINAGAAAADGEQLLILDQHVHGLDGQALAELLGYAQWPEIGAVGAKLNAPDGTLRHVGITLLDGRPDYAFAGFPATQPTPFFAGEIVRNWSAVSGACMLTSHSAFDAVGGFNATDFPDTCADMDYCLRLQRDAGRRIISVPTVPLYHHGPPLEAALAADEPALRRFRDAWASRVQVDPYYNPNLTTQASDFGVG